MDSMDARSGYIWYDGEFVPWKDAKTHVLTHTLHYGLGVFEGIRAYETNRGAAIFRLHDHINRLFQSAKILQMTIPFSKQDIVHATIESIQRNALKSAYIRPMCFYGAESMGIRAQKLKAHVIIAAWDWGKYIDAEKQQQGMKVKVSSYTRHHINANMCRAKSNGAYINSILALQEATELGYDEAILLDTSGYIAEGTGENLFIVYDNHIHTPQLSSCLDGITRATVMDLAKDKGLQVTQRAITRDELYICDEAFFTGTAAEVAAISSIDNRIVGHGKRGPITEQLANAYFELVEGKASAHEKWLTYCS